MPCPNRRGAFACAFPAQHRRACVYWDPIHAGLIVQYDEANRFYVTDLDGRHVAWRLEVGRDDDGVPTDIGVRSANRRYLSGALRAYAGGHAYEYRLIVCDEPSLAADWA